MEARNHSSRTGSQSQLYFSGRRRVHLIPGTSLNPDIRHRRPIDGVGSLENVLLDEVLLRPGHSEAQVEISLPDENGRFQILQIHTNKMQENSFLAPDVNLQQLAAQTKNYSGAELEGVVRSAVSFPLYRHISLDGLTKPVNEESIKVTMEDFLNALQEIVPAFGASPDDLKRCRLNGMVDCGGRHEHIFQCPSGSGKTAMAATIGIDSDLPYVQIISAETMIGLSESSKCARIIKVFEDAYKLPLSIIILDDIERLLEYGAIGPCFSNDISQILLVLLKKRPPKVLHRLNVFSEDDIDAAAKALNDMPIKKLYMVVEMAARGEQGGGAEAIYSGKEKIKISHFYRCLHDIV
ncbi:hypothetical protein F0562_007776 [Nyssa sinensis]|uniref:Vesicle-fusing ATPase n=1 Tax=Nyssa sinensis TaxID=561372 RepID=A0A5J5A7E9_9ASTE|nr:hypothetical protein F0562_007776 [Nyssa sinensis]